MSDKKIAASFSWCGQSGPDTYETYTKSMLCTRETTLGDVLDWLGSLTKIPDINYVIFSELEEQP